MKRLALILAMLSGPLGAAEKPNILWFVVDDMSANFSCYGEKTIQTPHVDRLAREGTQFTQCVRHAPVCSPCRSALITGMYQTTIGAHHHRSGRGVGEDPPARRRGAGSRAVSEGWLLHLHRQRPAEVTERQEGQGGGGLGKTDYNFEWDAKMYDGNDWSGRKPGQPFFMQVQLAGGKLRGGDDDARKSCPNVRRQELGAAVQPRGRDAAAVLSARPGAAARTGRRISMPSALPTSTWARCSRGWRRKASSTNTLVIFMTDHGISHARGKQFLYNEGTHVPFVVRGPGIRAGQGPRRPGRAHRHGRHSRSPRRASPSRRRCRAATCFAKDYKPRDAVFAARDRCDETVERIRSVRTERFLYIRNFHPQRPHLQPNAYKDGKSIVQTLRALHAAGKLDRARRKTALLLPRGRRKNCTSGRPTAGRCKTSPPTRPSADAGNTSCSARPLD